MYSGGGAFKNNAWFIQFDPLSTNSLSLFGKQSHANLVYYVNNFGFQFLIHFYFNAYLKTKIKPLYKTGTNMQHFLANFKRWQSWQSISWIWEKEQKDWKWGTFKVLKLKILHDLQKLILLGSRFCELRCRHLSQFKTLQYRKNQQNALQIKI